jgi:molybdate/tungstate transport system substrate-binding protein
MRVKRMAAMAAAALGLFAGGGPPAAAASPVVLTVFGAGTLAVPFRALARRFEKENPGVTVHAEFGGSVKMARQISDLHRPADILAVADYNVIPKYLFAGHGRKGWADWYAGIARNAVTFVYTGKSRFANAIDAKNWYRLLAQKGVEIGRSNPDTDPSGYQTVQMLDLASRYYKDPGLAAKILANAPRANMRDTETSLLAALQLGEIDYLAIYRSDALQHHLRYLKLPPQIDLSDPAYAAEYAAAVAHTRNGAVKGHPIVYAVTIPANAPQPEEAAKFVAALLGPEGKAILRMNGFGTFAQPYAVDRAAMPAALRALVRPWPQS